MSMPQPSNIIDFEMAQLMRANALAGKQPDKVPNGYAEVSQLISSQLQTTLNIHEILKMFFHSSQYLVRYDALHYQHKTQGVDVRIGNERARYGISYRLTFEGEYLGDLLLMRSRKIHEQDLACFESLTTGLIFPLRNGLQYDAAVRSALQDGLTGVGNRIAMDKTLQRDMDAAKRSGQPLSIIMLDIDHFKKINDKHGHACGDKVLVEVARVLQQQLRTCDAIFRFGGEEFLLILSNTCINNAYKASERIRQAIENLVIDTSEQPIRLSASLGCTLMIEGEEQHDFIQRADNALYTAKRNGRNRSVSAS